MSSEPLTRSGAIFGLNRHSTVFRAVMRIKLELQKDRKFKNRLEYTLKQHLKASIVDLTLKLLLNTAIFSSISKV